MYCGNNKTAVSSQRQIAKSLMTLLEEKPFDQISVCELCRRAGVSRQTFYSLFSSRENVVCFILTDKYCFDTECCVETAPAESLSVREVCRTCASYILQNRDFIRLLTVNHIDHLLYDSIYGALIEFPAFLSRVSPCTRRYAASFYAGGVSTVSRCYADEGCSCSAQELEDMLFTFFTGALF